MRLGYPLQCVKKKSSPATTVTIQKSIPDIAEKVLIILPFMVGRETTSAIVGKDHQQQALGGYYMPAIRKLKNWGGCSKCFTNVYGKKQQ